VGNYLQFLVSTKCDASKQTKICMSAWTRGKTPKRNEFPTNFYHETKHLKIQSSDDLVIMKQ